MRIFSLRQHFHSNAAYESLRNFFNKHLPSKRTLQLWYSSIDGSAGVNASSLKILQQKAESHEAETNYPLHVTLISDEMAIRKQIIWNSNEEKFVGYSTLTSNSQNNGDQETNRKVDTAKDALVFLIVGSNFKIPIAYYLLNGLDSFDRAAQTLFVIRSVEETGVRIMSVTSDGLRANIAVAKILGSRFDEKKTYFYSPTHEEQKIYIIFDPPHMLKLIRKHFSKAKIHSPNGPLIWDLLCILVEKQRGENFNLSNKLSAHHINWNQKPMDVRLAAQTISKSVADVLAQLQCDGYEEFEHAEATIEFLRNFNDIFDILNFAEGNREDKRYRQPINEETAENIFLFTEKMIRYIENIEIEMKTNKRIVRKRILGTNAHMGFFGFHVDLISLRGIYNDFVRDGPLEVFYTMMFSQDHLETLFSLIRSGQGCNDNPNAVEFSSAFRKLLVCHPLCTSKGSNVISNATGILTASSRIPKKELPFNSIEDEEIEIDTEELMKIEIELMDAFDEHLCAHIALCIEEKILETMKRSTKTNCLDCMRVLMDKSEKIDDALLKMKNMENAQPNKSTVEIVILSNAVSKLISSHEKSSRIDAVKKIICENLKMNELYTKSTFEHNGKNHKENFVAQVVKTCLVLKSQKIGKRITDEERGIFVRSRLKALTHLAGQ